MNTAGEQVAKGRRPTGCIRDYDDDHYIEKCMPVIDRRLGQAASVGMGNVFCSDAWLLPQVGSAAGVPIEFASLGRAAR